MSLPGLEVSVTTEFHIVEFNASVIVARCTDFFIETLYSILRKLILRMLDGTTIVDREWTE